MKNLKANKDDRRSNPIFCSTGVDFYADATFSKMEAPGQSIGIAAPPAPPMPWRLLSNKSGCKDLDDSFDGDDISTLASSGEKERNASESGHGDHSTADSESCDEKTKEDTKSGDAENDDDVHTLMIKNIPCRCTQQEVIDAIAEVGFADLYNFFYLPIRRGHEQNFGYGFIGFVDGEVTKQFIEAMTGYKFKNRNSNKACEIAPARIQGFSSNVEHFQKMRCVRRKTQSKLTMCV